MTEPKSENAASNQEPRPRILVCTPDSLGAQMAGPAIRALEIAKVLAQQNEVRLVSTQQADLSHPDFEVAFADDTSLRDHAEWSDAVVFQGHVMASHPWLADEQYVLVADIYDPMHLEVLEQTRYLTDEDRQHVSQLTTEVLNAQIERADFLLCASEKQRDFWLGQMAALGRINPLSYDADNTLRSLLAVAPFGIGDQTPVQRRHGIKGAVEGIAPTDKVVIWGGGIYNWFDPITLIRAVHQLSERHPDLRLFFLGVAHPNPNVPEMEMSVNARRVAVELDLLDRVVFFNEGWVPYDERADYLLDADLGVSTHFDHLETAFSFRTRILDYLWAGLPIVSTDHDTFATIVLSEQLGRVVPPEDVDALSTALEECLYSEMETARLRENVRRYAERMRWSNVLQPLVQFCSAPKPAADRGVRSVRAEQRNAMRIRIESLEQSTSWRITRPLRWVARRRSRTGA
ncbi:glycosyltransferase involved in cell wall biosynthesis [Agromyces sp. 3263]|uniref:glycosyltransferase n=1 Tax=Agromyces sp. 3263 TaxID=2817750 RepID=UPI0028665153|nr:glycosyltransferase [Agromyces sp. 3263]MDR6904647.1 glycosyltransferase involved in cell wall biosynthesis [Agromyces sp. 3263]